MLRVQQLRCLRENKELFSCLTFSLGSGAWAQIVGPNGSGKSSLLKLLVGLLPLTSNSSNSSGSSDFPGSSDPSGSSGFPASSGSIEWLGKKVTFPDPKYSRDVFYLGHKTGVNLRLTPFENLRFWFEMQEQNQLLKNSSQNSLEAALDVFEMKEFRNTPCDQLSAGLCQRVALARLTFSNAKLWILDEPCTSLDKKAISIFCFLLTEHLRRDGIAIVVSHTPVQVADPSLRHQVISLEELNKESKENEQNRNSNVVIQISGGNLT